jgi:hypothetical protein
VCAAREPCSSEEAADTGNDAGEDDRSELNFFFGHIVLIYIYQEKNETSKNRPIDAPRQAHDGRIQRR